MTNGAGAIDLPCSNSCEPDLWAFCAPDRTVAIPDGNGRAGEQVTCSDNSER